MIIFSKMQAVGNDFILIDCTKDYPKYNFSILSKFLCDRHFGVGADGVIYFYTSKIASVKMRIFNSDGSEAEMCGNGIRCLAKLVYDKKIVNKSEFDIETLGGIKHIKLEFENNNISKIHVNMGKAIFKYNLIPVYLPKVDIKEELQNIEIDYKNRIFEFSPVSVGNPHVVCFVNNFEDFNFEKVGEYVENYKYFPKKVNVEFVKVENSSKIKVKVWERGVGKTLGCGTGAIAASSVCIKKLYTDRDLIVELDGGKIEVKDVDGEYFLIGNSELLYEGKIDNL